MEEGTCYSDEASTGHDINEIVEDWASEEKDHDTTREQSKDRESGDNELEEEEAMMHSDGQGADNIENESVTTVMLCNIACRLSKEELAANLDEIGLEGTYKFIFIPLSKRKHGTKSKGSNPGYAFIDFKTPKYVQLCKQLVNGKRIGSSLSTKRVKVTVAHHQKCLPSLANARRQQKDAQLFVPDAEKQDADTDSVVDVAGVACAALGLLPGELGAMREDAPRREEQPAQPRLAQHHQWLPGAHAQQHHPQQQQQYQQDSFGQSPRPWRRTRQHAILALRAAPPGASVGVGIGAKYQFLQQVGTPFARMYQQLQPARPAPRPPPPGFEGVSPAGYPPYVGAEKEQEEELEDDYAELWDQPWVSVWRDVEQRQEGQSRGQPQYGELWSVGEFWPQEPQTSSREFWPQEPQRLRASSREFWPLALQEPRLSEEAPAAILVPLPPVLTSSADAKMRFKVRS